MTIATEAIDRLHTTAESHHRVLIVEVMGRHAGWIASHSGIAGGANVILIPERPFDIDEVCAVHRAPLRQPLRAHRGGRRGRAPGRGHRCRAGPGRSTHSATCVCRASGTCWSRRSPSAPARKPAPPSSVTCSAVAAPPRSIASSRPGSGSTPSTPCTTAPSGQMVALHGTSIELVPLAEATAQLKLVTA